MEINDNLVVNNKNNQSQYKEIKLSTKPFNDLNVGEMFKASVKNIGVNSVVLILENGYELNAKSLILPDARIGDDAIFIIKENDKGQILLEMLKPDINSSLKSSNIVREALEHAGMSYTKQNADLTKDLITSNLGITVDILQKASFFKFFGEGMDTDKLLFLIEENFPKEEKSIYMLNKILNNQLNLNENIAAIAEDISLLNIETIELFIASELLDKSQINNQPKTKEYMKNLLLNNLLINVVDENSLKNINNQFNNIITKLTSLKNILLKSNEVDEQSTKKINKSIQNVFDNLEFSNRINLNKEYFQIPFMIGENKVNAELFIYKDKIKNKSLSKQKYISALLSLNYSRLGHIEIFINKNENNIGLNFQAKELSTITILQHKINDLTKWLNQKGYKMSSLTFSHLEEERNVLFKNNINEEVKPIRYSFDMRI